MAKINCKDNNGYTKPPHLEISERQIEIFARRLLPEIKRFLADENIRQEFEEWQKKR